MAQYPTGIVFYETMKGPFALGETDPRKGARVGRAARTVLSIACTVTIHDLDQFIADPYHEGEITGHISSTLIGENMPICSPGSGVNPDPAGTTGVFKLFLPTDDPTCKLIIYEMAFAQAELGGYKFDLGGGKPHAYVLWGQKEVRRNLISRPWHDTTTIYTTLHEGVDLNGPVVGAGILTISIPSLSKMVASMHVTNGETMTGRARTLLRFACFFLGELWDSYGLHHKQPHVS